MEIKLTRDTLSQTYLDALRIRTKVFVEEQGVPYSMEVDAEEPLCIHFVLYNDDKEAVATARLLPLNKKEFVLQRMAVLKDFRGQGYAKTLVNDLLAFSRAEKFEKISLHAQLTAKGFYQGFGFKEFGQIFEEAGIDHVNMAMEI
ncbi:GNAT family N-acetyltransferase [Streptococcaceae bacterium ESL0729]|nr:GNAT family N-acetyltransferase [Streptococcaceae bacterium ESL0729]